MEHIYYLKHSPSFGVVLTNCFVISINLISSNIKVIITLFWWNPGRTEFCRRKRFVVVSLFLSNAVTLLSYKPTKQGYFLSSFQCPNNVSILMSPLTIYWWSQYLIFFWERELLVLTWKPFPSIARTHSGGFQDIFSSSILSKQCGVNFQYTRWYLTTWLPFRSLITESLHFVFGFFYFIFEILSFFCYLPDYSTFSRVLEFFLYFSFIVLKVCV